MRQAFIALALVAATLLSACGSDDSPRRATPTASATARATDTAAATVTRTALPTTAAPSATATSVVATATAEPTATTAAPATATAPPSASASVTATATAPASATPTASAVATATATTPPTPRAVARRISDPTDLIAGPLADGRVGDWLLANAEARFIIQDAPQRDLYSVGTFGGNLIDVELVGRPGQDNFLELQPAVQIETVINAQSVEVVNDGADGNAAVLRACGPDDVLDFVNPSTIIEDIGGLPFPAAANDADYEVEGCTEYRLPPTGRALELVTTLYNNDTVERGFYVGDYLNAGGQLEQWTSSGVGLGEILTSDLGVLSYIGFGEAAGVDYAHVTVPFTGAAPSGSSFFTAAGVSYVMQGASVINVILGSPPTFVVPAGGSKSFTRWFAVGDGSGSNALDLELALEAAPIGRLRGCVTVGGAPAPQARVAVGPLAGGRIASVTSIFVTGADGCYAGTLPPGSYGVAGARQGVPYEGGGAEPLVHPLALVAGTVATQDLALPATGRVRVEVRDERGAPLPARVGVVGFDPSPEVVFPGSDSTGLFYDQKEALRFGLTAVVYTDSAGVAEFDLEPGDYQLAVSRGVEYSLFTQDVTVTSAAPLAVQATVARVVDTTGFVSSDFHVHGIASADSRVPESDRVRQFAGEGVDNIVMTDHHAHTDLTPTITDLGFTPFVRATIGEEITTWDYGHFNAYPLLIDDTRATGGSTDWAVAAPAGRDFVAYGAFSLPPAALRDLAVDGALSTASTTIQINHIDSHFDPLRIDTALVPPRAILDADERRRFRLDPDGGELFAHFPALEVWNGSSRGKQAEFTDLRLGIWFNLLNQGLRTTAIGDTDTHEFLPLNSAGARTWTASPTDDPPAIDPADVARAVTAGRATAGQGVYLQTRLRADDGSGAVADLTHGGSVDVVSGNRRVVLDIDAQAPLWAPFDRIEIYANAATVVAARRGDVPTLYGAEPTLVLQAGVDAPLEREVVHAGVPGGERWRLRTSVPFTLDVDTWFVVIVRGSDGVSAPMFPVMADDLRRSGNETLAQLTDGNLGEGGVLAMAVTNALYADVDGTPGFDAPRRPAAGATAR